MTHFSHRTLSPQNPVFSVTNAQVPVSLLTSLPSHVQAEMLQGISPSADQCPSATAMHRVTPAPAWIMHVGFGLLIFFYFWLPAQKPELPGWNSSQILPLLSTKTSGASLYLKYKLTTLQPPQAALSASFQPSLPTCSLCSRSADLHTLRCTHQAFTCLRAFACALPFPSTLVAQTSSSLILSLPSQPFWH